MINEFKSLLSTPDPKIYVFSNSARLLVWLTRVFRRSKAGSIIHHFSCYSDSPAQLDDFLASARLNSLVSEAKTVILTDIHQLGAKDLESLISFLRSVKRGSILITSVGEISGLSSQLKKNGYEVFNAVIKNQAENVRLAKELIKPLDSRVSGWLQTLDVDDLLNVVALIRLSGYKDAGMLQSRSLGDVRELINDYLHKGSALRLLKKLSAREGQMMEFVYGVLYRLLALLYLKIEGKDKNYKLVPYWVRTQLSPFIKTWSMEEILKAIRNMLKLEIALKSSSLNPKEVTFLNISE